MIDLCNRYVQIIGFICAFYETKLHPIATQPQDLTMFRTTVIAATVSLAFAAAAQAGAQLATDAQPRRA